MAKAKEFILSIKFQEQENLEARKAAIYRRVVEQSEQSTIKVSSKRHFPISRKLTTLTVAASIAFLLLSLPLVLLYQSSKEERGSQLQEIAAISYVKKIAKRGEKLTLVLPDGSVVKLNAGSSLKYSTSFGAQREVYLQGEAYFEVARDTLKPFIVKAGEVATEVLGTSFNVKYSAKDSVVQVAVTSGKVAVTFPQVNERFSLLPTEVLVIETNGVSKGYFDEELLLGWKDDILVFENADIEEITQRLSTWYDVDIEVRGQTKVERKYSGKFKRRTLGHVLEGISYSSNFEFSIQQKKVIIELK